MYNAANYPYFTFGFGAPALKCFDLFGIEYKMFLPTLIL